MGSAKPPSQGKTSDRDSCVPVQDTSVCHMHAAGHGHNQGYWKGTRLWRYPLVWPLWDAQLSPETVPTTTGAVPTTTGAVPAAGWQRSSAVAPTSGSAKCAQLVRGCSVILQLPTRAACRDCV